MTISYDKQVLIKRGNTASVTSYVGPLGELVLNTDTFEVYVHDGVTPGGQLVTGSGSGTNYSNVNVKSYLQQFDGNIIPSGNNVQSLGSITNQWKSLYVSSNTIYINGIPLTIDNGNLTVNGSPITATVDYASITNAPTDISEFTDVGNLLVGTPGPKGDRGDTGPAGPQGIQGIPGNIGPQGPQGIQGEQGIQGNIGPTGGQGPQGEQGIQGIQGNVGPQGPQGIQGIQGIQGNVGPQGIKGDKGDKGDTGAALTILGTVANVASLPGSGTTGEAYIISTTNPEPEAGNLFVWDTLTSTWDDVGQITGPKGDKGDKGDTGDTGPQGPQGIQGEQGIQGNIGPQGPQGIQGNVGPQGEQGNIGPQGPQGIQGEQGIQGNIGPQGPQGVPGQGVPTGGSTGQVLSKVSSTDYDTQWIDVTSTGGSTANTGDITFSGVKIIGAGTASGDGLGYSTLELVPDNNLYTNHQYLVIDPTAPSHIHIRAGGTQDTSNAELYLGGERNHVRVRDGIGVSLQNDVFITNFYSFQQGVDYDTATWSTDESGNHWLDINITDPMNPARSSAPFDVPFYSFTQFPQNRIEVFDGTSYTDLAGNGQAYTLGNQYQLRIGITQTPGTNPTAILSLTFRINTLTQNSLLLENNGFDLSVNQSAYVYADQTIQLTTGNGNVIIISNDNTNSWSWNFSADGYLTLPQVTSITTQAAIRSAGDIVINANDTGQWKFTTSGNIQLPIGGDITRDGVSVLGSGSSYGNVDVANYLANYDGSINFTASPAIISGVGVVSAITANVGILKIEDGVHEKFQSLTSATDIVTHDCASGHIFYHTSPSANWTANFANLNLDSGYATSLTLVIEQGGTGYYPNAVQINGAAQTIKWQANTAPTPSANRVDVVSFSVINNADTYTVLGQLSGF